MLVNSILRHKDSVAVRYDKNNLNFKIRILIMDNLFVFFGTRVNDQLLLSYEFGGQGQS